ncbi:hypothetical protein GCM10011351_09840 [Paraliobacillus quinghaiensis]|uniref:Uncharacterized protein n=1 Tax=Paraliobacillus quinghaiensis TaxID=470815 RepID=A0A917WSZ2_9BACI|nr:hypothetical protein GCM10011351_09840 [Paraliobacillus quinghaiensis]
MSLDVTALATSSLSVKRKTMKLNERKAIVKVLSGFPVEEAFLKPNMNKA